MFWWPRGKNCFWVCSFCFSSFCNTCPRAGEQQFIGWVCTVLDYVLGLFEMSWVGNVLQWTQGTTNDFFLPSLWPFGGPSFLQLSSQWCRTPACSPRWTSGMSPADSPSSCFCRAVLRSAVSAGTFYHHCGVGRSRKVLSDGGPQELESGDPLHFHPISEKWGRICFVPPEVQQHLLCFASVQSQVVFLAPFGQFPGLISMHRLISSGNKPDHGGVVCKFNDCIGGMSGRALIQRGS